MKKNTFFVFGLILAAALITACQSTPAENPHVGPKIEVAMPELLSLDPDKADDKFSIPVKITHPAPIKDWNIQIQRRASGQSNQAQARPAGQSGRRQGPFFEQRGEGTPPKTWQWDGKGASGEMVQSATDYQFQLSATDVFGNSNTYEGIMSMDVFVRREGDVLRLIVPSIIFPPDSSDFGRLSEEDRRSNTRILRQIARVLSRFGDYKITVEGHANPTTAPNTPARTTEEAGSATVIGLKPLSEARAKAVMEQLITNNEIKRERLTAVGAGGSRTVAAYDDEEENWKNRRVEFILRK